MRFIKRYSLSLAGGLLSCTTHKLVALSTLSLTRRIFRMAQRPQRSEAATARPSLFVSGAGQLSLTQEEASKEEEDDDEASAGSDEVPLARMRRPPPTRGAPARGAPARGAPGRGRLAPGRAPRGRDGPGRGRRARYADDDPVEHPEHTPDMMANRVQHHAHAHSLPETPAPAPSPTTDFTAPKFPAKARKTGCVNFVTWWSRRKAARGQFEDNTQAIIMNAGVEHPLDILCPFLHASRCRLLLDYARETMKFSAVPPERPAGGTLKGYIVDICNYLKEWEMQEDARITAYGSWDLSSQFYRPLNRYIFECIKHEGALTGADIPLNLQPEGDIELDDRVAESINGKMGHNAETIFPEQLELVRRWLRQLLRRYRDNGYAKDYDIPYRAYNENGEEYKSTGWSDYVYYSQMLFVIDLGSNAGRRGDQDYDKLATTNFAPIVDRDSERQEAVGLWNVDAFVKKNSGRGFKRAPHIILNRGVNIGVNERCVLCVCCVLFRQRCGVESDTHTHTQRAPRACTARWGMIVFTQTSHPLPHLARAQVRLMCWWP